MEAWDLPGFGATPPPHFGSTKEEYVDWLIDRLERIGEPVDLVGHDWGGILTARVASTRPDLVRTWARGNCPISAQYVWHPLAKTWQDPVEGDRYMNELEPTAFAKELAAGFDVPSELAEEMVRHVDGPMKQSVLRLYQIEFGEKLATAVRASRFLRLDRNHWPLLQMPTAVAAALELHWNQPE
ncbi:alpha/beta fold hydrolase [Streptomyces sp. NBC_00019]|uniref:alpha/beta fold hydrolase n=1 Tax=Streptomyces sp. NBC_00019 TaxID=2975623 RepID=UPI00386B9581